MTRFYPKPPALLFEKMSNIPSLPGNVFHFLNHWFGRFYQRLAFKLTYFVFSFISDSFEARQSLLRSFKKITKCWRRIIREIFEPIVNFKPQFKADPHPLRIQFAFLGFGQTGQLISENSTAYFVRGFVISVRIVIRLIIYKCVKLLTQANQLFRSGYFEKSLVLLLKSQIMTLLIPRNRDSNCDSQNRPQTLHPPRCIGRKPPMLYPVSNRPNQKPKSGPPKSKAHTAQSV